VLGNVRDVREEIGGAAQLRELGELGSTVGQSSSTEPTRKPEMLERRRERSALATSCERWSFSRSGSMKNVGPAVTRRLDGAAPRSPSIQAAA